MLSEIGSNFWLNPNQKYKQEAIGSPDQFYCYGSDFVWLSTGRSAIGYVIQTIEARKPGLKKVAVLPSFTCDTVFEPFLKVGYEVYYYPVYRDLTTNSDAILRIALEKDASIILYHRYFGFDTLDGQIGRMCGILRGLGKYSIEDCTQCLYSDISKADADFTVGSIRKWTGTPDGGFAVCRNGLFREKPDVSDEVLEHAKVKASYAKYRYLFEKVGSKDGILAMYRDAEEILRHQKRIYAISQMAAKVQSNLDKDNLIQKRRENFKILSDSLNGFVEPLFALKSNYEVPFYFPILVEDRVSLQEHLKKNAVFAPIIWTKNACQQTQCEGAENAYRHLLSIPIDQRYGEDDMGRIVDVIKDYYT